MEFGDIIILLILLVPVLRRLFGKKQPKRGPAPQGVDLPSAAGEDPLAEALRQIRKALGEPEPTPVPSVSSKPLPAQPRPLFPRPVREPEFHSLGAFEHDEHGFGKSNPLSEETFERGAPSAKTGRAAKRIKPKPLEEIDLTAPIKVKEDGESSRSHLTRMLKDPARARDAFVLQEVFGPPRSRRPRG